jgi:hypothetical protein
LADVGAISAEVGRSLRRLLFGFRLLGLAALLRLGLVVAVDGLVDCAVVAALGRGALGRDEPLVQLLDPTLINAVIDNALWRDHFAFKLVDVIDALKHGAAVEAGPSARGVVSKLAVSFLSVLG